MDLHCTTADYYGNRYTAYYITVLALLACLRIRVVFSYVHRVWVAVFVRLYIDFLYFIELVRKVVIGFSLPSFISYFQALDE